MDLSLLDENGFLNHGNGMDGAFFRADLATFAVLIIDNWRNGSGNHIVRAEHPAGETGRLIALGGNAFVGIDHRPADPP